MGMQKEAVKEAATIELAKAAIVEELGVAEDEIRFEVLQEPQKKALGLFGGAQAKVRGVVEHRSPMQAALDYLNGILDCLNEGEVPIKTEEQEDGCVLTLQREDLGFLIGRRGDTLDALQYLVGLVANRQEQAYYRVTLDVDNYREKREQALMALGRRMAARAAKTGRKQPLEPMNPYERHVIHTVVQEVEGATSWSVGSDMDRHVVIGPSEDNPVKARSGRRGKNAGGDGAGASRGGSSGRGKGRSERRRSRTEDSPYDPIIRTGVAADRPIRQFVPRSTTMHSIEEDAPTMKTLSEKESSATLYGRIDI